jgi:hypothetical protein
MSATRQGLARDALIHSVLTLFMDSLDRPGSTCSFQTTAYIRLAPMWLDRGASIRGKEAMDDLSLSEGE